MRLAPGARLGPYEVTGVLGAGGMGEVYRARDTKLGREVAIKVLPERLARDATFLAMFEREAQAVAALSHPNILAIHEFGETDSMVYAVMELLQGQTLRQRLREGPLPVRKAVDFGAQIAAALAAAHARGIIHRDLKPENVFLTTDGHVKLLDFGLAVQRSLAISSDELANSPTIAGDLDSGFVVGTVGYMSPEQVRGAAVDHRSDIFSFGCVLYEMLTGERAFLHTTSAETMAAILHEDPPEMSKSSSEVPVGLERVVLHCLEKNPEERFQSARDLAFDLQTSLNSSSSSSPADLTAAQAVRARATVGSRQRERIAWFVLAMVLLGTGFAALHYLPRTPPAHQVVVSEIGPPEDTTFGSIALSPNGDRLAFVGWTKGKGQIWIRRLAALEQSPLEGTDGGAYPFWSPDGSQLGFFADGKLKKMAASGGPAQVLAEAPTGRGGSWSEDGEILFAPSFDLPLYRVSADGGTATAVTTLDAAGGELSHRWPYCLPGGKKFLFFVFGTTPSKTGVYAGSVDGRTKQFLVSSGYGTAYADPGYLIFTRGQSLLAQGFNPDTLEIDTTPRIIAETIGVNALEYAHFSASRTGGVLVYRRGGLLLGSELRWFSRSGQPHSTVASTDRYWSTRMSRDGRNAAVEIQSDQGGPNNIWIYDLAQNRSRRFTFNPFDDVSPIWSPDGRRLAYSSRRDGRRHSMYLNDSSGAGHEQPLLQVDGDLFPQDWSRDGRWLLYLQLSREAHGVGSIWMLPMEGERKPVPVVQTPFNTDFARFSPDGLWIAYSSNETGHSQVHVVSARDAGGKWQVSVDGGRMPAWRADGKELYYLSPDDRVMAVNVSEKARPAFGVGAPHPLFQAHVLGGLGNRYDGSPDGQRFLILVEKEEHPTPITLTLNWVAGLKQ
jgi:eukaryotic-like serine/threonine-protein kinase